MTLRVALLGPPQIEWQNVTFWRSRRAKTLSLLAYLLLRRESPVPRDRIAFALWPDIPKEKALANLRRHLHDLLRALPPAPTDRPWVLITHQFIQWNPEASLWLDLAEFERLSQRREDWARAVALYRGDLLEGVDEEEWLLIEREHWRNRFLACLEGLILDAHQRRDYAQAIAAARRLLTADPFHESALRRLMMLRYETGDRAGALSEYAAFAQRLRQEMRVDPMEETQLLYQIIARGDPLPTSEPLPAIEGPSRIRFPLVGRQREMRALQERWRQATQGKGGVILIGGEAGIGKSRLAAEFASWAEAQGGRVLKGFTAPEESQPYEALLAALQPVLSLVSSFRLSPTHRALLASLSPEESVKAPPRRQEPLDPERERLRLFDALSAFLEGLSRPRPLLIILEDLHRAGADTWSLLTFLGLRAGRQRLLFLGTFRSEEIGFTHPMRQARRRLQSEGCMLWLDLAPLDVADVRVMLREYPEAQAEAEWLWKYSGGNPFFLIEMLYEFLTRHALFSSSASLEATVPLERARAMLAPRLQRLSPEARALAQIAAVCGMAFDPELLAAMSGWAEARILDALETLLDHRLIEEAGGTPPFRFRHYLIQQAIYSLVPTSIRTRYHRRAARLLLELYPAQRGELAGTIGHHWERGGEAALAARWFLEAARHALQLYAGQEARRWLEQGLTLAKDPALRFDLLALHEEILARAGASAEWEADLNEMAQLAQRLQDPERAYQALHRQVLFYRARGQRDREREAIDRLRLWLETADEQTRRERYSSLLQAEGVYAMLVGEYSRARQCLEEALAHDQARGDASAQIVSLCLLAEASLHEGDFKRAERYLQYATERFREHEERFVILRTTQTYARMAFARQRFDQALEASQQALELARALGDRVGEADALLQLAATQARLFRPGEAEAAYREAIQRYHLMNRPQGQAAALINLAVLYINLGRYAQAAAAFQEAEQLFTLLQDQRGQTVCAINRSVVAHYQQDYPTARRMAQRGLELARAIGARPLEAAALVALSAAERELGDLDAALVHIRQGLALRRELGQTADLCHDMVDLVEVLLRRQDGPAAREAMEEMLALYRANPTGILHPEAVLWTAAKACRMLGEPERAAQLAAEARAVLETRSAAIPDLEMRTAFLNLPFNRELLSAGQE
ncbi:AAA family ATPase [Thermoflexus sp.]|uniref:ATP-binding protein n=1 Tax=Thermoflexus sp. TaxID=1969742 RepID=UPI0026069603|nr:AAA family ATPase [Thermoflexus sp.]MCX7690239.1 tetratricopeptide repeat protein [Thermoflexus sp.]